MKQPVQRARTSPLLLCIIYNWRQQGLIRHPGAASGAGASTPQRQEALPYLCDWECGAGGWEKHENCNCEEKRCVPESRQDEEERKEGKVRMGLTLKKGRPETPALPAPSHSPTPLLLSHRRGAATRDSHTSPQSGWSE